MAGIKISALPAAPSALLTDVFPVDQLPGPVTYKESNSQLLSLFESNITITDSNFSGTLSPSHGGTGIANTGTFTVGGNTTFSGPYTFVGTLTNNTSVTFPTSGTLATTSQLPTPAALTEVSDTNITLTLGGTPATALLQAVSITAGWSGTLSPARGGTGENNGTSTITLGGPLVTVGAYTSTFTMTNTTNVTFPTSGTLATTSQIPSFPLSLANGGTNAALTANNGGIIYSTASALAVLAGTATAGQILQSGASTTPAWSTATYPATTTVNQLLYSSSANVIGGITTANDGVLITSNAGVPSWLANSGTPGYVLTANSGAPPSWQSITAEGAITTINGDSGSAAPSAGVVTVSGGTTGLTTSGSSATLSLTGTLMLGNGGTNAALTASNGGIFYSTATSGAILSGTATANQLLMSGSSTTPAWSTSTYPATNAANTLLYASSANTMAALTTANSSVLVTSGAGVPSLSTTLPSGLAATNLNLTTPILGTPQSGTLTNCTLPVGGITGLGTGVATWLATPTSANLASAVATTSTGSGALVFGTSPTLTTPVIARINDVNGAEILALSPNATAVNYFAIANQSTGNAPTLQAIGSDTNVDIVLLSQAAGNVSILSTGNSPLVMLSGTSYQHGTTFTCANTSASRTITLPDSTGTMVIAANIANGSVATVLGAVGPVGSHTTVQTWLQIVDPAGNTRYIPCF